MNGNNEVPRKEGLLAGLYEALTPSFTTVGGEALMANVLCVLYDDPVDGYPTSYPRDTIPEIDHYPGGQTTPTPKAIDFTPGQLLGSVSGELGFAEVP